MICKQKTQKCLHVALGLTFGLVAYTHAYADDCYTLDKNKTWNAGLVTLNNQMNSQQWNDALKTAENLNKICERSPVLNYAMGRIYKGRGNDAKALYYMQRATLFTEEFAVTGRTLELMWFDRYEAEHPDARPESIAERQQKIDELTAENLKLKDSARDAWVGDKDEVATMRSRFAAGMWTGVAIAGAGLVMTGVGAYMVSDSKNKPIAYDDENGKYNVNGSYGVSWAILGTGIAATIAGTIVTGLMGYYYTHTTAPDAPVSISITPTSASLALTF